MGLVKSGNRFSVLSDISADEDRIGDMDLKVAGTKEGITALQMDIKTGDITREIITTAIKQAQEGLQYILAKMEAALPSPREKLSPYAPQIMEMNIPVDKIQLLIGKGGSTIRSITEDTGTLIDIHRETGLVRVSAPDAIAGKRAMQRIKEVTVDSIAVEVGVTYEGMVVKLVQSGAFISILPGSRGFIHVSELLLAHPNQPVSEVLQEKQRIMVKVLDIDRQRNRIKLTMKDIVVEEPLSSESD